MWRARDTFLITLILLAAAGCGDRAAKGPVVAKGKGVAVTAQEFKAKLDEQSPFVRSQYKTVERKKEFLENLIRYDLLLAEARRRKLDQDPEVRASVERMMVQKLVRSAFDEGSQAAPAPASDAETKQFYEQHLEEYVKPERVRLSLVFFKAGAGSAERTGKLAEARKRLERLKVDEPRNPLAFGNLARDASDDASSRAAGGDLGYRTYADIESIYSKPVAEAALALQDVGQLSGVVEAPSGLYLLKLGSRQKAVNHPFDEVREQIAARLGRERRTKDFDAFVGKLRREAGIEIDEAELGKIDVSTAAAGSASRAGAPPPQP